MKDILNNRVKNIIQTWNAQNATASNNSAIWYAVRDEAFDNPRFNAWVCRLFRIGHITELSQSQAVKLYNNIK